MAKESEINIGPPQNKEFLDIWEDINNGIERLNTITESVPKIASLKSEKKIDQSDVLSEVSKQFKDFEKDMMKFLETAHDFRGNPTLKFKKEVDIRLSTWHYLNLLHSRINYLERSYYELENQIQRTEDFIHKHNSNLKTEDSLRYGRTSIYLGWGGIILGIFGISFSFFSTATIISKSSLNNEIDSKIQMADSTITDESLKIEYDTTSVRSDTTSVEQ